MTYEASDSERYVSEALEDGSYDTIVAAGGDGSINEVGAHVHSSYHDLMIWDEACMCAVLAWLASSSCRAHSTYLELLWTSRS